MKRAELVMSIESFKDMLTDGIQTYARVGLPKNAVITGVQYLPSQGMVQVSYEHPSLEDMQPMSFSHRVRGLFYFTDLKQVVLGHHHEQDLHSVG